MGVLALAHTGILEGQLGVFGRGSKARLALGAKRNVFPAACPRENARFGPAGERSAVDAISRVGEVSGEYGTNGW